MDTQTVNETPQIERFLTVRGWKRDVNPLGEIEFTKGRDEWQVQISKDGWWALGKFTDSDIDGVATGRYQTVSEGETLAELEKELVGEGAMEWECPNCGESGGTPRTSYSREFQGCREHGGMVTWEDQGCSLCVKSTEPDYD